MKRGGRLPAKSPRRIAEADQRADVRAEVQARDRVCQASVLIPGHRCSSPFSTRPRLEVHEVESRGAHPGSHLNPDLCVLLCQGAHDAATADPDSAEWVTFRRRSTFDLRRRLDP